MSLARRKRPSFKCLKTLINISIWSSPDLASVTIKTFDFRNIQNINRGSRWVLLDGSRGRLLNQFCEVFSWVQGLKTVFFSKICKLCAKYWKKKSKWWHVTRFYECLDLLHVWIVHHLFFVYCLLFCRSFRCYIFVSCIMSAVFRFRRVYQYFTLGYPYKM